MNTLVAMPRLVSALALLCSVASCATHPDESDAYVIGPDGHPQLRSYREACTGGPNARALARTELYFGTQNADGSAISDARYQHFLDEEVTPRFGRGFTLLEARNQLLDVDGKVVREPARVLVLLYSFDDKKNAAVEEIRTAYRSSFQQGNVLRADGPACVAF